MDLGSTTSFFDPELQQLKKSTYGDERGAVTDRLGVVRKRGLTRTHVSAFVPRENMEDGEKELKSTAE